MQPLTEDRRAELSAAIKRREDRAHWVELEAGELAALVAAHPSPPADLAKIAADFASKPKQSLAVLAYQLEPLCTPSPMPPAAPGAST